MTEQPTTSYPGFGNYGVDHAPPDTRPTRRPLAWNGGTDIGLLLLRLGIGGVVFAHGAQKVFGLWGGTGIAGFATNLDGLRLPAGDDAVVGHRGHRARRGRLPRRSGLLTPLAAAAVLAIMINAVLLKLTNGFFVTGPPGQRRDRVLAACSGSARRAWCSPGPARIALDNGRAWHRRPASWGVLALVIGVAAAVLVYVLLRRPVVA